MSIQVQCGACGTPYRLADTAAGKRVKCRNCGNAIQVGESARAPQDAPVAAGNDAGAGDELAAAAAAAALAPHASQAARLRAAGRGADETPSARKRGVLPVVAVVVVGAGVIAVLAMNRSREGEREVAGAGGTAGVRESGAAQSKPGVAGAADAPKTEPPAAGPAPGMVANSDDASKLFSVNADAPLSPGEVRASGTGVPSNVGAATTSPTKGAGVRASPKPTRWMVRPNPPKRPTKPAAKRLVLRVGTGDLFYPDQPSPIAVIVRGRTQGFDWEVWDVSDGSRRYAFSSDEVLGEMIVSADGTRAAGVVPGRVNDVDVWSLKKGTLLQRFREAEGEDTLTPVCFVGDDKLVTTAARTKRLTVWTIPKGTATGEIELDRDLGWPGTFAQSPGGDYLARFSDNRLLLYNLAEETLAGEVAVPELGDAALDASAAIAFSPDGSEIAGMFGGLGTPVRIVVWDVRTANVTADLLAPAADPAAQVAGASAQPIRPLAWLPDASGWLLEGDVAISRASGDVLFRRPPPVQGVPDARWRPADGRMLLVLDGTGAKRMLRAVPVPKPAS